MYRIFSDGGSRGNPGPSAYAIVVTKDDVVIHQHSEFLGINTNNYAEYRGLIAGLTKAIELKADDVEFIMDSELVIKQMRGEYKVKNENVRNLHLDAKALSSLIPNITFRNVRRSEMLIPLADALLNKELDRHQ
ncbi:MAG: ribonuclease HI family protein [Methanomassiliicoccaceae archaeon]|nr:ribonuclease HI family protein [Methanomassiliicoccaceae archaeon]